jgi:hypothetical protein
MSARKHYAYMKARLKSDTPIFNLKQSIELKELFLVDFEQVSRSYEHSTLEQRAYYGQYRTIISVALRILRTDIYLVEWGRNRKLILYGTPLLIVITFLIQYLTDALPVFLLAETIGSLVAMFICCYMIKINFPKTTRMHRKSFQTINREKAKEVGVI